MTTKHTKTDLPPRKKLIEVALPLEAINRGCTEDKNRKTGHIRNLHKWFAPMPLPAWRTLLLASVIDDPGHGLDPEEAAKARQPIFDIIEQLAPIDAYQDHRLIARARALIAKSVNGAGTLPTVVDPFCGGGSTIVEAQRLGFPTRASDLNPIPVTITTALCRIPQLLGGHPAVSGTTASPSLLSSTDPLSGILQDVRFYAELVRQRAWHQLADMYPTGPNGETVIAWRWAWTVRSPDPSRHGTKVPLVTNWKLTGPQQGGIGITPTLHGSEVTYTVTDSGVSVDPTAGNRRLKCLLSGQPISNDYVRAEGQTGHLAPAMLCFVGVNSDGARSFYAPDRQQIDAAARRNSVELPSLEMPEEALGFTIQKYGFTDYNQLFLHRQAASIATFADCIASIHSEIKRTAVAAGFEAGSLPLHEGGSGATAYADAVTTLLGICLDRLAMSNNVLVQWFIDPRSGGGKATPAFRMQNISMVWDFVETNPFAASVGGWSGPIVDSVLGSFALVCRDSSPAEVSQKDARQAAKELPSNCLVATDPPYYANIGYADLSDFFYPWLRRCLRDVNPQVFGTLATPKASELIATQFRHERDQSRADEYFREGFVDVFAALRERTSGEYPALVIYALKQSEGALGESTGWEVFLDGIISSGMAVVATWPIRTTTLTRSRALSSNALASAICVVCRSRPESAPTETRGRLIAMLKAEMPIALQQLQKSNIAPVDLAQAAIGPGMAVFSRFSSVIDADGIPMTTGHALTVINQVLDEVLAEQEVDFDSDSRWALTWFDQHGFSEGEFGVAETLSKAKNTSVQGLQDAGILTAARGKVRILRPNELSSGWDPQTDPRLTTWEMVHHLIRALDEGGEAAAAALVARLGSKSESARELCYRLYTLCERKKRANEAIAYNTLVQSWPEIARLARGETRPTPTASTGLFGNDDEE